MGFILKSVMNIILIYCIFFEVYQKNRNKEMHNASNKKELTYQWGCITDW